MQLASLLKREASGAPVWAWLLGLLPWIWIIPFNQYFWDDWITAPLTGWEDQIARWDGGAKHYLNPVMYFVLLPIGQWAFHLLMVVGSLISAVSLSRIAAYLPFTGNAISAWVGPLFLGLPVFHSRFSAAVLEYVLAVAALLVAWAILLRPFRIWRWITSLLLVAYAIGVPSLAVLLPFAWVHISWKNSKSNSKLELLKSAARNLHLLLVPVAYVYVFQVLLNTKSRYQPSVGALTEFFRALGALVTVLLVMILLAHRWQRQNRRSWYWVSGLALLAYFGLFPYFAVGYNPLSDFLPWRMREEVLHGLLFRIALPAVFLGVIAAAMLITVSRKLSRKEVISGLPTLVFVVGFGVIAVAVGPMDWESRHWLIAWPVLAVLVLALVATAQPSIHKTLVFASFTVFLASSLVISSEYLVDSLKQKAIIQAVDEQLRDVFPTVSDSDSSYAVVVELSRDTNMLNARYRTYRSYEWLGLIAEGLKVSPSSLRVFEGGDLELQSNSSCSSPFRAIRIQPLVTSSRFDALTRMRVGIDLNAQPVELCSLAVKDGYPRDS